MLSRSGQIRVGLRAARGRAPSPTCTRPGRHSGPARSRSPEPLLRSQSGLVRDALFHRTFHPHSSPVPHGHTGRMPAGPVGHGPAGPSRGRPKAGGCGRVKTTRISAPAQRRLLRLCLGGGEGGCTGSYAAGGSGAAWPTEQQSHALTLRQRTGTRPAAAVLGARVTVRPAML